MAGALAPCRCVTTDCEDPRSSAARHRLGEHACRACGVPLSSDVVDGQIGAGRIEMPTGPRDAGAERPGDALAAGREGLVGVGHVERR